MDYKERWEQLIHTLTERFSQGEELDVSGVLFLIGVQEKGDINQKFKKDQKIDLLHIALCRVLEPYGFYKYEGIDEEGWPHYSLVEKLPDLKSGEQSILINKRYYNTLKKVDTSTKKSLTTANTCVVGLNNDDFFNINACL